MLIFSTYIWNKMTDLQEKKTCTNCNQDLPLDRFSPGRKPGSTRYQCKSCASSCQKKKYREDNPIIKKLSSKQTQVNGETIRRCNKCLEIKSITLFEKRKKNESKTMSYCKECEKNIDKVYQNSISGKFSRYKAKARSRKITFNLNIEEFSSFWQLPCNYCGIGLQTCGLDRIDSSLGYETENIVSCCKQCNFAKLNRELSAFIGHINKLHSNISSIESIKNKNHHYEYCKSASFEKRRFYQYYHSAKERNITWSLSREEFFSLWGAPCFYCQSAIEKIGVDRINNDEGYFVGNIISCCEICNRMKLDYSIEEFSRWVKRAYDHLSKRGMIS